MTDASKAEDYLRGTAERILRYFAPRTTDDSALDIRRERLFSDLRLSDAEMRLLEDAGAMEKLPEVVRGPVPTSVTFDRKKIEEIAGTTLQSVRDEVQGRSA